MTAKGSKYKWASEWLLAVRSPHAIGVRSLARFFRSRPLPMTAVIESTTSLSDLLLQRFFEMFGLQFDLLKLS